MPLLPGRVDGMKVDDKRTYTLPTVIQKHYKKRGLWDRITDARINTNSQNGWETYTVRLGNWKHTWKYVAKKWQLVKEVWL